MNRFIACGAVAAALLSLGGCASAPAETGHSAGALRFPADMPGEYTDFRVQVSGRLQPGALCPVLKGDDGRSYSLVGPAHTQNAGSLVQVDGYLGRWSGCDYPAVLKIAAIAAQS